MKVQFSTKGIDAKDQFDAWREQLGSHFGLAEIVRSAKGTFDAKLESVSMRQLRISDLQGDAMSFERSRNHISYRDRDCFAINLVIHGQAIAEQDGRITKVDPGDLVLGDFCRPLRFGFDGAFRQLSFECDRTLLEKFLPSASERLVQRVQGRPAVLLAMYNYIVSLATSATAFEYDESVLARHVAEVLAFAFGGAPSQEPTSLAIFIRIKRYIEDHLSDPVLTPKMIALQHRISVRSLYRLFGEFEDSVAGFIRHRRLLRCKSMLADNSRVKRSISEIAFMCGFNDATTFGRAFLRAFGLTPREYRRRVLM